MNPFYAEILSAIESELDRNRQTFILSNHYDSVDKQRNFIETLLQLGGDGVIMSPTIGTLQNDIKLAEDNGMPTILIARSVDKINVPTYRGDDAYGIALATNHLIGLGHRCIAMVGGTCQTPTGRHRYEGYVHALEKANIPVDPDLRISEPRTKQAGFEGAVTLLSLPQKPTAAVCWNDLVAIGLMNGIARAGLTPGKDISVTGYDDLERSINRHAVADPRLERPVGSRPYGGAGAARQAQRFHRSRRVAPDQA